MAAMAHVSLVGVPSIVPADLSTTTLALLQDPYAFTQTRLLSPEGFSREAKKRGVRLTRGQLEHYHRRRVLLPFYEIHSRPVADAATSDDPAGFFDSSVHEVRLALAEGRLSDPARRHYSPWPHSRSRRSLWYSSHQLLLVRSLSHLQARMHARQTSDPLVRHMDPLDARGRERFAKERSLAFLVEALASKYRPRVLETVRLGAGGDEQDLFRFLDSDDEPPGLRDVDISGELLVRQADQLLAGAGSFDPLGAWSQVVRIADPRRWEDLPL